VVLENKPSKACVYISNFSWYQKISNYGLTFSSGCDCKSLCNISVSCWADSSL